MKKTIVTLAMAAVVAAAGLTATPQPAKAQWWIAPAIAGGALLGFGIGTAVAYPCCEAGYYAGGYTYAYAPQPEYVYVSPRYFYQPGYIVPPRYVYDPGYAYAYIPSGYVDDGYRRHSGCYYSRVRYHGHWRRVRTCG